MMGLKAREQTWERADPHTRTQEPLRQVVPATNRERSEQLQGGGATVSVATQENGSMEVNETHSTPTGPFESARSESGARPLKGGGTKG
jgi:hypothetical protein